MAQFINEPMSGGLVTSRPAHMLEAGEFTQLDNCAYRFDSHRLLPAEPKLETLSSLNSGSGWDYTSLGFMQFDDGTAFYATLTPATSMLRVIEAGTGASELDISTNSSLSQLVVVPFRNQQLILDGETNQLVYHTGGSAAVAPSYVQLGVNQVTTKPAIAITTGTWPLSVDSLDQYYEYWYSEIVVLADGTEVESDVSAAAVVTTSERIDSLSDAVQISIPSTLANSNATYFNIYRGVGKEFFGDTSFPNGISIAERIPVSLAGAVFTDGGTTGSAALTAGTVTGTGWTASSGTLTTACQSDDTSYAQTVLPNADPLVLTNFTFTGLADPITGIKVTVRAFGTGSGLNIARLNQIRVKISNGTTTDTGDRYAPTTTTEATYVVGGTDDKYDILASYLVAANFTASRFSIELYATGAAGETLKVDLVNVTVYTNNSSTSGGVTFPAVILDINGDTASVGANGKPAVATVGCIHEDTLVTNDIANPSFLRWGVPGDIHAQPSVYFNDMETPRNDAITYLGSVAGRVAIGLETCLWRANYLPNEDDATFSRGSGRAFEEVDPSFGIVGPLAATPFVGPDGRPMLAFVSLDGLRITDLFSTVSACDDVDWRAMLTPSSMLSKIVLVNYPRNHTLRLYYPAGDSTYLIKYMDFLYHPNHLKNGKFKAVGPVSCGTAATNGVTGAVAAPSLHSGYSWSVVEAWKGSGQQKLYRRVDLGTASSTALAPTITTRDMFLAGFGNEWQCGDVYLVGGIGSTPLVWTPSLTARRTNAATFTAAGLSSVTASYNPTKFPFTTSGNGIKLSFTTSTDVNDASNGWDLLSIEANTGGKENK